MIGKFIILTEVKKAPKKPNKLLFEDVILCDQDNDQGPKVFESILEACNYRDKYEVNGQIIEI